jgi:plastocyanin
MRKAIPSALAIGLVSLLLIAASGADSAQATPANLDVHVHDNYYHPEGAFIVGPGTDHTLAQAACQGANPAPACDAVITQGETVTWVTSPPLTVRLHTVTECTDNTFSVCGPAVDAANPIGDSGVRNPPPDTGPDAWPYGPVQFYTPGTYYYRCEIHPNTMRGRVVVEALVGGIVDFGGATPGPASETAASSDVDYFVFALGAGVAAATLALAGAAWHVRRRAE